MNHGDRAYRALHLALADADAPECSGDDRFILEHHELAADEVKHLRLTVCGPCPLRTLCRAYGDAARPQAGIWGGKVYPPPKPRKRAEVDQ
ncbi:WhiB family transcriptional regulator [Microbacterium sp. ET2]|uniref:WhiB family transcriptional regulator n=1 Tax=Microbacterium albipurpureum TaxID=3050384 RepID=UPI00259C886E|nr:WhiB family transcriptional regulator [Microbacterium sp. ET2 (Ac-2212)]WJL95879.1 WhiB family transcriptional regulator [Microbacterium sp. ET2 (Ac-2212)]